MILPIVTKVNKGQLMVCGQVMSNYDQVMIKNGQEMVDNAKEWLIDVNS